MSKPLQICEHSRSRCYGTNSRHVMRCACGCAKTFVLGDPERLAHGRYWSGEWYMAGHNPNDRTRGHAMPAMQPVRWGG